MKKSLLSDLLRISLGMLMIWPFFDKLLGLGFKTCSSIDPVSKIKMVTRLCAKAWVNGGSPTGGFLTTASGPLGKYFNILGNNFQGYMAIDWLFMVGLLAIGLCFLLGVGLRIAGASGALMMVLMYFASFVPETHPFVDDHIVYAFAFLSLGFIPYDQLLGFGKWWCSLPLIEKYPLLR